MNYNEYVRLSLELHLFFDRIMKEHSFFLETSFMESRNNFKVVASNFRSSFEDILDNVIMLSNGRVSEEFLSSSEAFTKDTIDAEKKTSVMTGIPINCELTNKEKMIECGNLVVDASLVDKVCILNRRTMSLVHNLIQFKTDILNQVLECKIFTTNYPLFITHIMNEAKMYYSLLTKLENHEEFDSKYIYEQELFWNQIMMEHAELIRNLLDPTEVELMETSNKYAEEYKNILDRYRNNPEFLTNMSLQETIEFQKFKVKGGTGILNCKIKSLIMPLLADHVLREANHFLRILKSVSVNS